MTRRKTTPLRDPDNDPLKSIKGEAMPDAASSPPILQSRAASYTPAVNASGGSDLIVLDAVITIAEAASLKDRLLSHINRKGEVCVDGSQVQAVDTAALQILLSFVRTLQGQGAVVRWTGVSEALLGTAELLGVASHIGLRT